MTDTPQVKKSEIISVAPLPSIPIVIKDSQVPEEVPIVKFMRERVEKLAERGLEVPSIKDLVIRNYQEWIAVQALRKKKDVDKTQQTQLLMNKFKKIF